MASNSYFERTVTISGLPEQVQDAVRKVQEQTSKFLEAIPKSFFLLLCLHLFRHGFANMIRWLAY
jgi:hypothetical protein